MLSIYMLDGGIIKDYRSNKKTKYRDVQVLPRRFEVLDDRHGSSSYGSEGVIIMHQTHTSTYRVTRDDFIYKLDKVEFNLPSSLRYLASVPCEDLLHYDHSQVFVNMLLKDLIYKAICNGGKEDYLNHVVLVGSTTEEEQAAKDLGIEFTLASEFFGGNDDDEFDD